LIAKAMGYAAHPASIRQAIWTALDAAQTLGYVAQLPNPADLHSDPFEVLPPGENYIGSCLLTQAETAQSYGAKVAHALKIEVDRVYPWRLTQYSEDELREILNVAFLYTGWLTPSAPTSSLGHVVNHCPFRIHQLASSFLGGPGFTGSHDKAVSLLLENGGRGFGLNHNSTDDPAWATTVDNSPGTDKVSRHGCHSSSAWFSGLCQSVNIPSEWQENYYSGGGHASITFRTIGKVMTHGDHMYVGSAISGWGTLNLESLEEWNDTVVALGPTDRGPQARASFRLRNITFMRFPHPTTKQTFCNTSLGWPYLEASLQPRFGPSEQWRIDKFELDLQNSTGCSGVGPTPAHPIQKSTDFSDGVLLPFVQYSTVAGTTVGFEGLGTSDARLTIDIPSGASHWFWQPDRSCRVMQFMWDTDFLFEAKFDTPTLVEGQCQGIVVQDQGGWAKARVTTRPAGGFYRTEFSVSSGEDATTIHSVSAYVSASPMWLRLGRVNDVFIASYSTNGTTFTSFASSPQYIIYASHAGIFAGSDGVAPFTAKCDYFYEGAYPVTPEDPIP